MIISANKVPREVISTLSVSDGLYSTLNQARKLMSTYLAETNDEQ